MGRAHQEKGRETGGQLREPAVPQLLCALPGGPGDPEAVAQANCMLPHRLCVCPPSPVTWLSATEKAAVSLLAAGGRRHVWGQVGTSGRGRGGRAQVPGKQGVKHSVPRAPAAWGAAFPYSSLSPSLSCPIAKGSCPPWSRLPTWKAPEDSLCSLSSESQLSLA